MYVTRPLSLYLNNPSAALDPPPGPNSGYLVVQDEEAVSTCCFGSCEDTRIRDLPFPQNKDLAIRYTTQNGGGNSSTTTRSDDVILIPVLNEPLSSNHYYAIEPHGRHIGEAHGNLKDEDKAECLCFRFSYDVDPVPLDPSDVYQQFVIYPSKSFLSSSGSFYAKSVAPDGHPPGFLKRNGWRLYGETPRRFFLGEAPGILDDSLRDRLPRFDFPVTRENSDSVLVGKWYCPFMFVRDGTLRDQIKKSMYYEMTLHQRWDQIYGRENSGRDQDQILADVKVKKEAVSVAGKEARGGYVVDGVVWFVEEGENRRVGLSSVIVERMRWEVERVGWVHGDHGDDESSVVTVKGSSVEGLGNNEWKRFGCYVLVERFVLKRMDGSLVLTYDFKHTNQVRYKWE